MIPSQAAICSFSNSDVKWRGVREEVAVMWRGKGGISVSHSRVGEGELAQDWHAEILIPGGCEYSCLPVSHPENVEDKSSVPECGIILHVPVDFQGQGGCRRGGWLRGWGWSCGCDMFQTAGGRSGLTAGSWQLTATWSHCCRHGANDNSLGLAVHVSTLSSRVVTLPTGALFPQKDTQVTSPSSERVSYTHVLRYPTDLQLYCLN